ncbi:unnamed protein product, partial [Candidula unifasciata]
MDWFNYLDFCFCISAAMDMMTLMALQSGLNGGNQAAGGGAMMMGMGGGGGGGAGLLA